MEKKGRAIVFFSTPDMAFAVAQLLVNLKKTNSGNYDDVVIYHSGFDDIQISGLRKLEQNIIFKEYTYSDFEKEHTIKMEGEVESFLKKYTYLSYVKYKIFELLSEYKNVVFMDLDMLVLGDLSELFEHKGMAFRNGRSFFDKITINSENNIDPAEYPELFEDIPQDYPSPNEGLICISDDIDHESCIKDCRKFLNRFAPYYQSGIDGLYIAWAAYRNNIDITSLKDTVYNTFPKNYTAETRLVHFMDSEKIWNNSFLQCVFPSWMENYDEASGISGIKGVQVKKDDTPGDTIKRMLNCERWLRFLKNNRFVVPKKLKFFYNLYSSKLIFKLNKYSCYFIKAVPWSDNYICGLSLESEDKQVYDNLRLGALDFCKRESAFYIKEYEDCKMEILSEAFGENSVCEQFVLLYRSTLDFLIIERT